MASRLRGLRAAGLAWFQLLPAEQGRASWWPRRLGISLAAPVALPVACDTQWGRAAAAPSTGRRTSPASRAPHTNFCPASPTSAAGSDLRSGRGAQYTAWVAAEVAPPRQDDLATVALVLLRLGGYWLATRQRPTTPAGHVSGAGALRDAWGERAPWRLRPTPDSVGTLRPEPPSGKGWRA